VPSTARLRSSSTVVTAAFPRRAATASSEALTAWIRRTEMVSVEVAPAAAIAAAWSLEEVPASKLTT
jgi:hypothetical protein